MKAEINSGSPGTLIVTITNGQSSDVTMLESTDADFRLDVINDVGLPVERTA